MAPVVRSALRISDWITTGVAGFERRPGLGDEPAIENVADAVVLRLALARRDVAAGLGLDEDSREVETLGLPVGDGLVLVEPFGRADQFVVGRKPISARCSRTSSATKKK